jgi:hypothetical protein
MNTLIHVCGAICGERLVETYRRPDGEPRWCFRCRSKQQFDYVVRMPVEDPGNPSYYGPTPDIRCATCGLVDGDIFPGREREWSDE